MNNGRKRLNQLLPASKAHANDDDSAHHAQDAKEPRKSRGVFPGDFDVHAEETADQVHRNQDRSNQSDLAQHLVDVVAQRNVGHVQLSQIIGVRTAEHLLEVCQVGHHGHDVILNITQIKANVTTRSHRVLFIAALGKSANDVRLAAEKAHQTHDFLAQTTNPREERLKVIDSCDEDVVFDRLGLKLHIVNHRTEAIDDVITGKVVSILGADG